MKSYTVRKELIERFVASVEVMATSKKEAIEMASEMLTENWDHISDGSGYEDSDGSEWTAE